jgi:hypothetical protein
MSLNYENFVNKLAGQKAPEGLLLDIVSKVSLERLAGQMKKHLFVFSSLALVSFVASGASFYQAQADFSVSGLGQFFSLLFSDFTVVASYWQTFVLSVAERVPFTSLMALCGSSLVFVLSLKMVSKDIKNILSLPRPVHN